MSRKAGFTFLETLVALILVALLATGGYALIGRKLVDDGTPLRLAKQNGYVEPKVVERHDFLASEHGCNQESDAVAFVVEATHTDFLPPRHKIHVCCGAWFAGCRIAQR